MTSTAIDLNNEGVLHLDAGEYEKAAFSFKEASKLILTLVAKELPLAMAAETEAEIESHRSKTSMSLTHSSSNHNNSNTVIKRGEYSPATETPEKKRKVCLPSPTTTRPRKRARRSSATMQKPCCRVAASSSLPSTSSRQQTPPMNVRLSSCNVSGRPLWMKKPAPGKKGFRATTEAAIILYNLGLTFHLNATRVEELKSRQWMYRRSLDLYNMAKELILGSPAAHAFESPVFLVALHNIANVYQELGEIKRVSTTQKEIAAVLRLLRASNLVGIVNERGYEGFYLKLLSLPPSGQFAAAA